MLEKLLQEPFTILLILILFVAIWGLISNDRQFRHRSRELIKSMALLEFSPEKCCECNRREECNIFILATRIPDTSSGEDTE